MLAIKLTNKILEEFIEENKNIPGLLAVQDDGITRNTIIAFVDDAKLPADFPTSYKYFQVYLYDVKKSLKDTEDMIKEFDAANLDMRNSINRRTRKTFLDATTMLDNLLNEG